MGLSSLEDIRKALEKDAGFNNKLASMSESEKNLVNQLLHNKTLLENLAKFLPESVKEESLTLFHRAIVLPKRAVQLYEECRFLEARETLLETINIYSNVPLTGCYPLDEATCFVATRQNALCNDLLGDIEWNLGNPLKAAKHHEKALEFAIQSDDRGTIAKALLGLGIHHWEQGNHEKALELTHEALNYLDGIEDYWRIRDKICAVLSMCHEEFDNIDEALEYALSAVEIVREFSDKKHHPEILNNLACLYMSMGESSQAIDTLQEALSIANEAKALRQQVVILNNLATCHLMRTCPSHNTNLASSYLDSAYSIVKKLGSPYLEAFTHFTTALVHQAKGESREATAFFQKAIEIYHTMGAKEKEALALTDLAFHLKHHCNDLKNSISVCKRAIEIFETLRTSIKREAYRINYASRRIDPYEMILESLASVGQNQHALTYAEKAKSRALTDYLKVILTDDKFAKKDSAVLTECLRLLKELEEIQRSLNKISEKEFGSSPGNNKNFRQIHTKQLDLLKTQLQEKSRALNKAYSELVKFNPDEALLIQSDNEFVEEIYEALDNETLILALFQTHDRLYEFVLSRDGPLHTVIIDFNFTEASELITNLTKSIRNNADVRSHEFLREVRKPLSILFDALISPVLQIVESKKRIIFIPHLFWHYVPFSALWDRSNKRYLCDIAEVGNCPSISILNLCLARQRTEREKALIIAKDTGNIPHVDREAELLSTAFRPDCYVLKEEDANLQNLIKQNLTRFSNKCDVIHFACHGYFDPEQPYLSGIDIPPEPCASRRSYVIDLFNLNLNCNLVTLSACDSGLSKITQADELIGLCRGLFYAGATSVMLSLWKVADESTCYLMENFYWHYVKNRRTKTRALQLAMQAVKAKHEYPHPFYWAPFMLMGDWR